MAFAGLLLPPTALAAGPADNTWTALSPLPQSQDHPLLALAVDPSDGRVLLAGTASGEIYRSADGGQSWRLSRAGLGRGVAALSFSPFRPGFVLAGTRGSGIWRSTDGGLSWQPQPGTESRSARAFSFTKTLALAGTDQGVLVSHDLGSWAVSGLNQVTVSALAASAVNEPTRLVAGGDGTRSSEALPLFTSGDGGQSWAPVAGTQAGSSMVAMLTAGPLPSQQTVRPLLLGTNTGLFLSTDNGSSWQQLTGGGALPATDFTSAAFVTTHADRFYVASDGGGAQLGGLWSTGDTGGHVNSLSPPVPSVTALAVSNDDTPTLYVATFRGGDHSVMLWSYRDAGGQPRGPAAVPSLAPGTQAKAVGKAPRTGRLWILSLLSGPEAPYLVLGFIALLVLVLAGVTHFRRARRL
ncbi:MAG: hypothetical protein DLM67_03375 [Candidatus Nephthysia bennettiae]|uniref:Photosynthesis system II assembly factor Ycf48/Hcf136-like domain-containing protein n=2 Tax=Candidatus Nephthysia bennettiae TaxID=3127016 RepID=A0A934KC87_9BACT|nr:hypothetical protein [Candidatus Dormibacteraeota bacterium]MBJ7614098.1 hypothetical protein [Candidatus Dormibacteraeota bacterium]PZR99598.1 MAG: hypothetical protein DLM67_03375 [Candidatus Dormibacteraeota bacterium]